MAITQVNVTSPAVEIIFQDSAIGASIDAIKASSAKMYYLIADNTNNVAASYIKFWNLASGSVTIGTSAPDMIVYLPGSSLITMPFFTGATQGIIFGTALSAACVTSPGTAGSTPPSSSVILTVSYV